MPWKPTGHSGSASGARTFILLISTDLALKYLVISRPALLGVSAQIHEVGVSASYS
jgi:hypothetical protein